MKQKLLHDAPGEVADSFDQEIEGVIDEKAADDQRGGVQEQGGPQPAPGEAEGIECFAMRDERDNYDCSRQSIAPPRAPVKEPNIGQDDRGEAQGFRQRLYNGASRQRLIITTAR